jgi:hypothetical protein
MPEVIYNYDEFLRYSNYTTNTLFLIIEYKDADETERYSILRNECLKHPSDFKDRLNNHIYRIWIETPREVPWQEEG